MLMERHTKIELAWIDKLNHISCKNKIKMYFRKYNLLYYLTGKRVLHTALADSKKLLAIFQLFCLSVIGKRGKMTNARYP